MSVDLTGPFEQAVELCGDRLRELSSRGRKIVGYFCTYTPVELIHAAGFLPVRVMGGAGSTAKADSLTPNFICPYMRAAVEKAIRGEYAFLSGLVQGYTCDVACGVMKIWEENVEGEIYHTIPLPYNDSPDSRRFFRGAIEDLTTKMEAIGGRLTDDALDSSLKLYEEIRALILGFYEIRYSGKSPLSAADFLVVIQAGFVTPPEDYLVMLRDLATGMEKAKSVDAGGVPVLISGSLVEEPRVLEILEESGGRVVADDLCTGLRHFHPPGGEGRSPRERLMDRYINRFPCPARSRAVDRAPLLVDLMQRSGARGVVFLFQKFCTPHLADHPTLTEEFKKDGIPSVAIEMEETGVNEGQLRTRLEAFFEMLE